MKNWYFVLLAMGIVIFSCQHDSLNSSLENKLRSAIAGVAPSGSEDYYILPSSKSLSAIPQSPANPLTPQKVALGMLLFHEPAFSVEPKHQEGYQTFSCASCHISSAGFKPNRMQGIADGASGYGTLGEGRYKNPLYLNSEVDAQGARPLALVNTAYVTNSMWNGAFGSDGANVGTENMWGKGAPISFDTATNINNLHLGSLEGQNIQGLITHRMNYNKASVTQYGYKLLFDQAFPDEPEATRYSRKTASFAISAYLRQILATEAPFQHWLKGTEDALSEEEKRGALLFFGKAGCSNCHFQQNLGSITFQAVGVKDLFENGGIKTDINDRRNLGRGGFTGNDDELYRFRVPQLYNLADAGPYFHGSSKQTLREVIEYFNNGVKENDRVDQSRISPLFHPLNLSTVEMDELEAFLANGLRDPNLIRYQPLQVLSGFCFPNNDLVSKFDMGCN